VTLLTTWPTVTNDSGTKTDGTIFNQALTDAIKAAIEAVVHSTTNPTISPEDLIDEVVDARGSRATLDARLDISLNEDGTLRTGLGMFPSLTEWKSALGAVNIANNGDLDYWNAGGAAAPDQWTLAGAGATIERTGTGMVDTFNFGAGNFAAKITRAAANVTLTQTVIGAGAFTSLARVKGRKFSVFFLAKSSTPAHVRIVVYDGATTTEGAYHSGGGTTEGSALAITHLISNSATQLEVRVEVNNTAAAAYVGGFQFIFSDLPQSDWAPLSPIDATEARRGIVTAFAQNFGGVKDFYAHPRFMPGTSGSSGTLSPISGVINASVTPANNSGVGETNLYNPTIDGNTLSANGKALRLRAFGSFAANGNTKTVRVKWGATTILTFAGTPNAQNWEVEATIIRTGAATQVVFARILVAPTAGGALTDSRVINGTAAETLSGDVGLQITGQSDTASNDVTFTAGFTEVVG
jgi:hypothetical protein